jgi:hypothetical protein
MATYSGILQGDNKPRSHFSLAEWSNMLKDKKSDMEKSSGFKMVPSPLLNENGFPIYEVVEVTGHDRVAVDFAELFLYNNPAITMLPSVADIFPVWMAFLRRYLLFHWPSELRNYQEWLRLNGCSIGAVRDPNFFDSELDRFVARANFIACMNALMEVRVNAKLDSFCSATDTGEEPGYRCVSDVLWDTRSLGVQWHITTAEVANYIPLTRLYFEK